MLGHWKPLDVFMNQSCFKRSFFSPLGIIFMLCKEEGVQKMAIIFPYCMYCKISLRRGGGSKNPQTPLRNIKMVPYVCSAENSLSMQCNTPSVYLVQWSDIRFEVAFEIVHIYNLILWYKRHGSQTLLQMIWLWNHTSQKKSLYEWICCKCFAW